MQTNQPAISTIKTKDIIGYQNVAVVTTRMLADFYETEPVNIRMNFNGNKEWFVEGESYFQLTGESLKNFRKDIKDIYAFSGGTGAVLYLWTEEGALLHSKMINTRQAWLIYKMLLADYFDPFAKKLYREASRKAREAKQVAGRLLCFYTLRC